jgi:hypothetical protein
MLWQSLPLKDPGFTSHTGLLFFYPADGEGV